MINPYFDQTIADQFQAEADLSEFDPLDIAVLGNVASKKKNDIGINKLKQDAAFGLTPMQSVFKLYNEKRQKGEELAKQQAETDQFDNLYASMDDAMGETMGYGGESDLGYTNPDAVGFANKFGTVADTRGNLGYPQAPTQTTPGSYTAGLNTQLGTEMAGLYNIKREYAPDEGYNQAMAAVREALGKAPAIPTMQKPELKKEDQALILLAGLFGGMDKIPQAMQGALAGATQRAQIANQQAQNTFEQQQGLYNQQLRGLQSQAELEAQRRQQAQTALDRQYENAYRASQGRISKIQTDLANAPFKEAEEKRKQEGMELKKEGIDANAQAKVRQANKAMLDKDYQTYYKILETKMKQPYITKADYEGLLGRRNGLIEKYKNSNMGDIGSLFYVPQVGVTPDTARKQVQDAYDFGMRTGRRITKEIGGSFFGDVDASPIAPDTLKELNKLQDNYRKYANKDTELDKRWRELSAQAARLQTPSGGDGRGMMGTFKQFIVKPENKKKFDELVKEIEKIKTQKEANKKLLKPAQSKFEKMAKDLGIPLVPSKTPGNKTSQNTVETNLGTFTFPPKSSYA